MARHLMAAVDEVKFGNFLGALDDIVTSTDNDATVAVFCHGGVVNIVLQELLGLERPLTFPIEYVSVTR
ncbi:histidine phosphatase family protein, partial [Rhodococcus sp. ARC_M6]|nr:histidine phosphatase family protein [Rhodococcus sp. ARC_M6]